ncbi:hypothetical protein ABZ352_32065 [Streptomyces griseofuscus]|uniref:hypothetical protein n=1 Tax=Streptomyces griseofuscus TaxID=146922 RepID=UPI00340E6A20
MTWTPPGFAHTHRFYGRTDARLLTVPVELCGELLEHPCVFAVGPLPREGLLALTGDRPEPRPGAHRRPLAVVSYDRLRAVTDLLHADPARPATPAGAGSRRGGGLGSVVKCHAHIRSEARVTAAS